METVPLDSAGSSLTHAKGPTPLLSKLGHDMVERLTQPVDPTQAPLTGNVSKEVLLEPAARISQALRPRGLEFEISEEHSRIVARVIDRETGHVIRQIPGEEVLAVARRFEEMQGGLISLEA